MKVLLINPPIRLSEPPEAFPFGLGYIAAALLQDGHQVEVLDINANRWTKSEVAERIQQVDYQVVGIGGLITTYKYVKWLIPLLRKYHPEGKILVGDNGASSMPHLYLQKGGADVVVVGEGDITIGKLLRALEQGKALSEVNGICFVKDGSVRWTSSRKRIDNIDNLLYPAWDLFPIEIYLNGPIRVEGIKPQRHLGVSATRGCPYPCTFCYPCFGRIVRMRSAASIIREIKFLKKRYDIRATGFSDDLFMVDRKRFLEFCKGMINEKLNLIWGCTGRVNLVDEEMLRLMKAAGCVRIGYGIESGSQKMLDSMKKKVTVEQARRAIELTRKVGIICDTSFIIGVPGETRETVRETIDFIKEMDITISGFFYATPYPGTELYRQAKQMGKIKNEEEYVMSLGDATDFTINLTEFTDAELINLRGSVQEEMWMSYFRRHIFKGARDYWRRMVRYYRFYGFRKLVVKFVQKNIFLLKIIVENIIGRDNEPK